MTVSTTNNYVTATGNGSSTVFPYTFRMLDVSHMVVTVDNVVVPSGYTVSINSNGVGGNVTFTTAPANLAEIILERSVPITQGLDLEIEEQLPEGEIEDAYDKLTVICQQLQDQLDRSFTLNIVDALGVSLQLPAPAAGKLIAWNAAGDALENTDGTPGPPGEPGSMTGPATSILNRIASFNNTVGTLVKDSGILATDVVLGPATATNNAVPLYDGATGKLLKNGVAPGALNNVLKSDGTNWVSGSVPSSSTYVSPDQVITVGGALTLGPHNLGGTPVFFAIALVCQTAQAGYSVGDTTQSFNLATYAGLSGAASAFASIWGDATNVNIRYDSAMPWAAVIHKTTGVVTPITLANWKARFYARL